MNCYFAPCSQSCLTISIVVMVRVNGAGHEITFYSVWYEFRYGITACLMLTIGLITVVFYFHPSTKNVTSYYRTIPILPETNGRVAEVYVGFSDEVKKGAPLFRLDDTKLKAALIAADKKIAEVDAAMIYAEADIAATQLPD